MLRICFYYAEVRKSSCNKLQTFTLLTIKNKQAYFVLRSACITFVPPNGGGSGKDLNSCYLFNCKLLVSNGLD